MTQPFFQLRTNIVEGEGGAELLVYHCSSLICTSTKRFLAVLSTIAVLNATNCMHIYSEGFISFSFQKRLLFDYSA